MNEGTGTTDQNLVDSQAANFSGSNAPTWNTSDPSIIFYGGGSLSSYLDAGADLIFDQLTPNQMTVVAKVYVSTLAAAGICEKNDGNTGGSGFAFGWDSTGALRLTVEKSTTNMQAGTLAGAVSTGQWVQLAFTWDGTVGTAASAHLFINGTEQAQVISTDGSGTIGYANATSQSFRIGNASIDAMAGSLNGKVAYLAVYKGRILSPLEMGQLDSQLPIANPSAGSFSLSASPTTQTVTPGSSTTFTITSTAAGGFNNPITLSVAGLPTGASASFSPSSLTGSGSTTLTVTTTGSTPGGDYQLTITGTSGSLTRTTIVSLTLGTASFAGQATFGQPVTATYSGSQAITTLTFPGIVGQRISIGMNWSAGLDRTVTVYQPDGTVLFSSVDPLYIDTTTLTQAGTYTLTFLPWNTYTGTATFTIYNVPQDFTSPITVGGQPVTAYITTPGQNANWTFSGTAGQRINITRVINGTGDRTFTILNPDGSTLYSTIDERSPVGVFTLASTGTYTIVLDPWGSFTGGMSLTLWNVPPDIIGSISIGDPPYTVTMVAPGQAARLTFSGTAGQQATVQVTNNLLAWETVTLLDPSGNTVTAGEWTGNYNLQPANLPVTGTYTILIQEDSISGNLTGSVSINVTVPVTVSVAPTTATLYPSQTQQLTATVANTSNTAVTWSINPSGVGSISTAGLYTAPATIASAQTVTVTATSVAAPAVSASATVSLSPAVTVSVTPATATLSAAQTQQFTATVTNASNTAVTWSISPSGVGSISSTGLYTAPASIASAQAVTVTATSVANTAASGTATVTLGSSSFVSTTGVMGSARSRQAATRLASGQILVTGGMNSSGVSGTADLYNPASQTFSSAGSLVTPRWMHTATLLNDGTVLIVGGSNTTTGTTLNSAEIYDPVAGTFTALSNTLTTPRAGHTATLLTNGQVLFVGGIDPTTGILPDAELYDPLSQSFIYLGYTTTPRFAHTATLLPNGHVLIAGGETDPTPTGANNTAEIFNPVAMAFIPVRVPMTTAREGHSALLLNNGQVLIAGGDVPGTGSLSSAELYNPSSHIFTAVGASMTVPRISATMTLLNGGTVLIAGGATDAAGTSTPLNASEVFDPNAQTFTAVGNMTSARQYQTASLLNDGTVLIAGGTNGTNVLSSAELYMASQLNGLSSIAITPSAPSLGVGAQQVLTATGTFSNGSTQSLASVLWTSSSASVGTVTSDSTNSGGVSAVAQGTTTITASAAGVSGSGTLIVTAATLKSIILSPQNGLVPLGGSLQLSATGVYSDGSTQDITASSTWNSSAPSIATVSGGLVSGVLQGVTSIQVTSGSLTISTNLIVASSALVSIAVSPATTTIASGTTVQYQALGTFSDGSVQNVTTIVGWTSSAPTVAAVSTAGLATGTGQGASTITATFESISSPNATLTVGLPNLASIAITPITASVPRGGTQQLTAVGTYTDGSQQNLTASATWSSSNSAVFTVNSSGIASPAATTGTATITATLGSITGTALLAATSPTTQATLNTSRYQHSATLLNNGQILVAGGVSCPTAGSCTYLNSAEIYNSPSDTFSYTGSMTTARSAPAVLLTSGKVLVAGGYTCDASGNCSSLSSVELYDPNVGTFSSAGTMTSPRSGHTMTLLNDGTVLIAGGQNCTSAASCTALSSGEIYNPVAGTFTAVSSNMSAARFDASAVEFLPGLVLIAGGFDGTNPPPATELFSSNAFEPGGNAVLNTPRFLETATLLNNGQVLIAGGSTCALPGCPSSTAESYFSPGASLADDGVSIPISASMVVQRFNHTATLLTNGQVLLAGGFSACNSTCTSEASTELYDPIAQVFTSSQALTNAVAGHTATLLPNGNVLVIGGISAGITQSAAQSYQPSSQTPSNLVSIAITPGTLLLSPGQTQQLTATGTLTNGRTQTLQSVIWTSSNPSVALVSNSPGSAGVVTVLAGGTATLTATAGTISASVSLEAAALQSLAIIPANPTVAVGAARQLTASATFSDGTVHDLTAFATWSSSNTAAVTLGASSSAQGSDEYATGASAGTSTITATVGGSNATTTVTVPAAPTSFTPNITSVSPSSGAAGTQVTISGSGFGPARGSGAVILGTTYGTIISWSSTQIVATVASNSQSGVAQVLQTGNWSNGLTFNVSTATISSISPTSGLPGTVVTVAGSGFGASRGSGQVWLGTARAAVASWSDTQIVAEVAIGSRSGNAQVLQSGVMSNAVPFLLNTPQITSVSPTSGPAGTTVTITGTGFGASQGSGTVVIGGVSAPVVSWNNTQIVVIVPGGALTGPLGVQQNSVPSNPVNFIVPSPSGNNVTIEPNVLNMLVGDTATIQAINSALQPVTGLAWASSNPNIVSLSTDDPPILTAVAVGHVTITSGNASADVTVWPSANAPGAPGGGLPLGTTIWSNPADAYKIVPAVPSSSGVADIFAFLNDFATVQAIKSDGTTAWSATLNGEAFFTAVPDFMGGLVVFNPAAYDDEGNLTSPGSIQRLDGITGQPYPAYVPTNYAPTSLLSVGPAVHPDGTVFAVRDNWLGSPPTETALAPTVVGIDPTSGAQKFTVPIKNNCSAPDSQIFVSDEAWQAGGFIIAGDGYAYLPHYCDDGIAPGLVIRRVSLMRINTNGESDDINILSYVEQNSDFVGLEVHMITNADTGVLLSWISFSGAGEWTAITNGTGVSVGSGIIPGQDVQPVVQAQDGSFVGVYFTGSSYPQQPNIVAFDQGGNVRWIVPNDQPQIATDDGGVIGQSGVTYDQTGNAAGQLGPYIQSWTGNLYQDGLVIHVAGIPALLASTFWALQGANSSFSLAAAQPLPDRIKAISDTFVKATPPVERDIQYVLMQGSHSFPPSKGGIIVEHLQYISGSQPPSSPSPGPGKPFLDGISTNGIFKPFELNQTFTASVPGYRDYKVRIEPCIPARDKSGQLIQSGEIVDLNHIDATNEMVLVNGDAGNRGGRTCSLGQ